MWFCLVAYKDIIPRWKYCNTKLLLRTVTKLLFTEITVTQYYDIEMCSCLLLTKFFFLSKTITLWKEEVNKIKKILNVNKNYCAQSCGTVKKYQWIWKQFSILSCNSYILGGKENLKCHFWNLIPKSCDMLYNIMMKREDGSGGDLK